MKFVKDITGARSHEGELAVELEYEGRAFPREGSLLTSAGWTSHSEGSLRGSENIEYVSGAPVSLEQLGRNLTALDSLFKSNNTRVDATYRAGTHVHVNVQKLSLKQVITYLCVYLTLEEIMADWCEPYRKLNHHCLLSKDAEGMVVNLVKALERDEIKTVLTDTFRYGSVNTASLMKFGSLEFRLMESTRDFTRVFRWAKVLKQMKDYSLKFDNPVEFVEEVKRIGYETTINSILLDEVGHFKLGSWQSKMVDGFTVAQEIAYSRTWSEVNLNIFAASKGVF